VEWKGFKCFRTRLCFESSLQNTGFCSSKIVKAKRPARN
jgi:hypothetical protein